MSNPVLAGAATRAGYTVFWIMIAAGQLLVLHYLLSLSWPASIADALISCATYGLLALSFWYPCKSISLEAGRPLNAVLNHLVAAGLAVLLWIGVTRQLLSMVSGQDVGYLEFLEQSLPWRFIGGLTLYLIIAAFYYLHIYYHRYHQKALTEAELTALVREAEIRSLKFQINPHFIYNSLNSINALIHSNPPAAGEMTVKLSRYLRATLAAGDQIQRTLQDELETSNLYVEIEQVRFGDRLVFRKRAAAELMDAIVPAMLLQPLLENAIKHGLNRTLAAVEILLEVEQRGELLYLRISNNFDEEAPRESGAGIGLKNIRERLAAIHGRAAYCDIREEAGMFTVTVTLPYASTSPQPPIRKAQAHD